ncbi:MAG: ISAs1 family transposase [Hymenobacteraceae bacterium]|nr:ISAs1 family transposase [Hymenobacteraceae bacterium]
MLKLKANHPSLFAQVQAVCRQEAQQRYNSTEYEKGRQQHRSVEVYQAQGEQKEEWQQLRTFIKVTRSGSREGKAYERTSYYISDLELKAKEFAKGIRLHWTIENCLHWVKDVVFKEDKCRAKMGNGPANLSILRSFAISVLARMGNEITKIIRTVTNKPDKIAELLE